MLTVGYLRKNVQKNAYTELLAVESERRGIDVVYFTPEDINVETNEVTGQVFRDGDWQEKTVSMPIFVDVFSGLFGSKKYETILAFLKKRTSLSLNSRYPLPRSRFPKYFKKQSYFYNHVIRREEITAIGDVEDAVVRYGAVLINPKQRKAAGNSYIVEKESERVVVQQVRGFQRLPDKLSLDDLKEEVTAKAYVMERFIEPVENTLQEAEFAVHVEKGGEGAWQIIQTVMDGVNGRSMDVYLEQAYSNRVAALKEEIELFILHFAKTVDKIRKFSYMSLTIYIVLDKEGKVYIRKVLANPSVKSVEEEVAKSRAAYYTRMAGALYITPEEKALQAELDEQNVDIEEEIVQIHEEEAERRRLIEQGLLEEEKPRKYYLTLLGFLAIVFVVMRLTMKFIAM